MPIFHKRKTIFIRVPKTASTSMHMALGKREQDGLLHETAMGVKNRASEKIFNSYFKFSFVRNPWDWVLSWSFFKLKRGEWEGWTDFDFNTWIEKIGDIAESRGGVYWTPGVEFAPPKSNVIKCGSPICRANLGYPCACLMVNDQNYYFCNKNKEVIVDFVGKFENLEEDWKYVVKKVYGDIPEKLGHFVKTDHKPYRQAYTDKTSEIIRNLYKKDIEMFGYDF